MLLIQCRCYNANNIRMIKTSSERLKARNLIFRYSSRYEKLKFVLSRVEHEKSFINSRPGG